MTQTENKGSKKKYLCLSSKQSIFQTKVALPDN